MLDSAREIVAFGLIIGMVALFGPWLGYFAFRRKREKLRRRGIKRHGH